MDVFLGRVTPPQGEPQAGPSGGVPKKTLLSWGMTAPCVFTPEELPVGQDVEGEDTAIDDLTLCRPKLVCVCVCVYVLVFNKKSVK